MKKQFRKTARFVMTHKSAVVIGIVAVTVVGRQQREIERLHEEHICMGAIQTSASVSMRSPWREVPDADA